MADDPKWASEDEVRSEFQGRTSSSSRATRRNIIEKARENDPTVRTLLDALENTYMNGFADEVSGDVDSPSGHFYRVDRWIVTTDVQGFHYLWNYVNVAEAEQNFRKLDKDYSEWLGEE